MSLKVIKTGMLDTIQDAGRTGYRHLGMNPSGAIDLFSARLSNALLGKTLDAPVIEMHFPASQFLFEKSTIGCLSGADFSATIDEQKIPLSQPFFVRAGSLLQLNGLKGGAHCYLSLIHNLQIEKWLNSTSTNLKAGAGGWMGRKLEKDDCIGFEEDIDLFGALEENSVSILHWKALPKKTNKLIECIQGNEWDWLTTNAQEVFLSSDFFLSNLSDRMGYRLYGEELSAAKKEELVSSAVDFGTIQLLPNGQLIVLMADHQTTGGYPRIAHVTTTSLSSLAQLTPGNNIHFRFISVTEAENNFLQQQKYLEQLRNACKLKMENLLNASMRS